MEKVMIMLGLRIVVVDYGALLQILRTMIRLEAQKDINLEITGVEDCN